MNRMKSSSSYYTQAFFSVKKYKNNIDLLSKECFTHSTINSYVNALIYISKENARTTTPLPKSNYVLEVKNVVENCDPSNQNKINSADETLPRDTTYSKII